MRGVRFTKAERDLLERCLDVTRHDWTIYGTSGPRTAESILAKLKAAVESPRGVSTQSLEDPLFTAAMGKVVRLEAGHDVVSRRATAMKVTPEQMTLVGEYLARSNWLTSPVTILDVLNKWYTWLPKARATQPPPALPPGLGPAGRPNADGPGPAPAGKATQGGRPSPGFGRKAPHTRTNRLQGAG